MDEFESLPKPVQKPHPPIVLGGQAGPRSARLAARWADEYNTFPGGVPDECARRRAVVAEAWDREGRDPATLRFSGMTTGIVGEDRADLLRRTARVLEATGEGGDPEEALRRHPEWVAGTVEEVVARLRELEDAGLDRIMLRSMAHGDLEMLALLGREVVPRVG